MSPDRVERRSLHILRAVVVTILLGASSALLAPMANAMVESADAPAPSDVAAQVSAPAEAAVSILMTNTSGLDLAAGSFNATFYLGVTCAQTCASEGWDIMNARAFTREEVSSESGVTWWRVNGTFTFNPELRLFPFDTQYLPLEIEHDTLDASQLILVPDAATSEVTADAAVSGWEMEDFEFTGSSTEYVSLGTDYSRVTFTVPVTRSTIASITKYYIPLVIFILLGAATLVLVRSDYQIRTGGTALVGLTIFYLATSGGVGSVGYLTVWDLSVLLGYIALGLVLICGVIGAYLFHEGAYEGPEGEARSKRMRFRYLYAVITLVVVGAIAITAIAVGS